MNPIVRLILAAALVVQTHAFAEAVKDREGAVRQDKAAMENDARWNYNELDRAFAEARRTGKPLLAVLRCVPCLGCAGIDAAVIEDKSLASLLDQFVCARIINANALDLSLFQFDYDLSLSALMFNGDGTVYGRFGSWRHQKDKNDKSTAGFRAALEGALALHKGYPANKDSLRGKQGAPIAYKTPVNIPTLDGKYRLQLDWQGKVVPSCVHCHQIGDALRLTYRNKREPIPESLVYPMPSPETLGFALAADARARVEQVMTGAAAAAVLQAGDDIATIDGVPVVSIADVSWALHRAPEAGALKLGLRRAGTNLERTLNLAEGWRSQSDISRRVGTWEMRALATGGLLLEELSEVERHARGISMESLALRVKHVGQYGKHAAGKKAGFAKDDVLVEADGQSRRMTEGELIGALLRKHPAGDKVNVTVLRGTERVSLVLPMQ